MVVCTQNDSCKDIKLLFKSFYHHYSCTYQLNGWICNQSNTTMTPSKTPTLIPTTPPIITSRNASSTHTTTLLSYDALTSGIPTSFTYIIISFIGILFISIFIACIQYSRAIPNKPSKKTNPTPAPKPPLPIEPVSSHASDHIKATKGFALPADTPNETLHISKTSLPSLPEHILNNDNNDIKNDDDSSNIFEESKSIELMYDKTTTTSDGLHIIHNIRNKKRNNKYGEESPSMSTTLSIIKNEGMVKKISMDGDKLKELKAQIPSIKEFDEESVSTIDGVEIIYNNNDNNINRNHARSL